MSVNAMQCSQNAMLNKNVNRSNYFSGNKKIVSKELNNSNIYNAISQKNSNIGSANILFKTSNTSKNDSTHMFNNNHSFFGTRHQSNFLFSKKHNTHKVNFYSKYIKRFIH